MEKPAGGGREQSPERPGPELPGQQMFTTIPAAFSLSLSEFVFLFETL